MDNTVKNMDTVSIEARAAPYSGEIQMAGYSGYSKSNNAIDAEEEGRFPITVAAKIVSEATGLKRADAKALLEKLHNGEYHHTSKFYNRTRFYDAAEAIRHHELSVMAASWPADWRKPLDAARKTIEGDSRSFDQRHADIEAIDARQAAAIGAPVDDLTDAYYSLHS